MQPCTKHHGLNHWSSAKTCLMLILRMNHWKITLLKFGLVLDGLTTEIKRLFEASRIPALNGCNTKSLSLPLVEIARAEW